MKWTVDQAHTVVGFSTKHLGISTVRGRFTKFDGWAELDDPSDLTKVTGRVEVDLSSIDTGNEQRDGHLKSGDFFNVETNPKLVYEVHGVTKKSDDTYEVTGDLTMNGVTKPVTLNYEHGGHVTDPYGNPKLGGTLTGTIDRKDWNITWNVPLAGGGLLVGEKVKIEVEGQMAPAKEAVEQEAELESKPQDAAAETARS